MGLFRENKLTKLIQLRIWILLRSNQKQSLRIFLNTIFLTKTTHQEIHLQNNSSKLQEIYNKYNQRQRKSSHQIRHSLDYTDSKTESFINKSNSTNNILNKNLDYIQNIMEVGQENVSLNQESNVNQKFNEGTFVKEPWASCVAQVSRAFLESFNKSIMKFWKPK